MAEPPDLAASVRTAAEWIASSLSDVAEATLEAKSGGSLHDVALALQRIGAALEQQSARQATGHELVAGAIEALAAAVSDRKKSTK